MSGVNDGGAVVSAAKVNGGPTEEVAAGNGQSKGAIAGCCTRRRETADRGHRIVDRESQRAGISGAGVTHRDGDVAGAGDLTGAD